MVYFLELTCVVPVTRDILQITPASALGFKGLRVHELGVGRGTWSLTAV